jgi:hypothetical protein
MDAYTRDIMISYRLMRIRMILTLSCSPLARKAPPIESQATHRARMMPPLLDEEHGVAPGDPSKAAGSRAQRGTR